VGALAARIQRHYICGGSSSGGLYVSVERDNKTAVSEQQCFAIGSGGSGSKPDTRLRWNLTAISSHRTESRMRKPSRDFGCDITSSQLLDESKNHCLYQRNIRTGTGTVLAWGSRQWEHLAYALYHREMECSTGSRQYNGMAGVMDLQLDNIAQRSWGRSATKLQGHSVCAHRWDR